MKIMKHEKVKLFISFHVFCQCNAHLQIVYSIVLQQSGLSREDIPSKSVNNTVSTKGSYKASINLPDGSKVWLNGDSKITYDGDFQGKTREVHLSGEAFFDVAKDKTRPFIIHTRTINLKVLGTAFNVRSYDNEKETETALVHG